MCNIKRIIATFILLTIVVSCNIKNNHDKDEIKSVVEGMIGQKLSIPEGISLYSPVINDLDSINITCSAYKIYSYVDVSCGSCLNAVELWNKLLPKFTGYDISLILVCGAEDRFELFKYLCESGKMNDYPFPFFLDMKNEFLRLNKFMKYDPKFETVLTNQDNNILLVGNPIRSKEVTDLYLKVLEK